MPRTTIAQACRDRGINRKDWDEARRQGVDPWDRAAMDRWLGNRRPRVKVTKTPPSERLEVPAVLGEVTVEELENQVKAAVDWQEVRTIKEKITSLLQAQKFKRESGELLSRREVDERDTRIAAAVKASLLKFANDCPAMLEGLDAPKIQKVLKDQVAGVLAQLADDQSEFWKE